MSRTVEISRSVSFSIKGRGNAQQCKGNKKTKNKNKKGKEKKGKEKKKRKVSQISYFPTLSSD